MDRNKELKERNLHFSFIDLFAGIGGFRIAFENVGGKCIFSSDVDKWARHTYLMNFNEQPRGDITKIKSSDIPDHDILCAGFPCQPFSIAGRRLGFSDTRGTLFFEIERILRDKKPKAFILENVKGLINHNNGATFKTILNSLQNLNYNIFYRILNSMDYGVPQNRERLFIIGFKKNVEFNFPEKLNLKNHAGFLIEKKVHDHKVSNIAMRHINKYFLEYVKKNNVNNTYPIFATEIRPSRCLFRNDGISPCLTAKMGTGGNNVPVLINEKRKLTVCECLRLQGFPEWYKLKENNSQSYKQIGNSVTIPVIELLAKEISKFI